MAHAEQPAVEFTDDDETQRKTINLWGIVRKGGWLGIVGVGAAGCASGGHLGSVSVGPPAPMPITLTVDKQYTPHDFTSFNSNGDGTYGTVGTEIDLQIQTDTDTKTTAKLKYLGMNLPGDPKGEDFEIEGMPILLPGSTAGTTKVGGIGEVIGGEPRTEIAIVGDLSQREHFAVSVYVGTPNPINTHMIPEDIPTDDAGYYGLTIERQGASDDGGTDIHY